MVARRHSLLFLELIAAAVTALSVLAVLVFAVLTMGPVKLDFLTPYIERALSPPGGPVAVRIGGTKLTWEGWQRPIDVVAENVKISNPAGQELATLDRVSISLSVPGLFRGLVAPTSLEIHRPTVRLTRLADGRFEFGLGDTAAANAQPALHRLIGQLLAPLDPVEAAGYLEQVSIVDAQLTLDDQLLEKSWFAAQARIDMQRTRDGLGATFQVPFQVGDEPATVRGKVNYGLASEIADIFIEFRNVVPARFAAGVPALERLSALNIPVGGEVKVRMNKSLNVERVTFDVLGRGGRIHLREFDNHPLDVQTVKIEGRVEQDASIYIFENIYIDFGNGPNLSASAVVSEIWGDPEIKVNLEARKVGVRDLDRLWPAAIKPELRNWVRANVASGIADKTTLQIAGQYRVGTGLALDVARTKGKTQFSGVSGKGGGGVTLTGVSGTAEIVGDRLEIDVAGATAAMRGDIPKLTGIRAHATLVPDREAVVNITSAVFGPLALSDTVVRVTGLDRPVPLVDGEAVVTGPLSQFLEMMQSADLGGAGDLGVDPSAIRGEVAARARFRFEMGANFRPDRIQRSAAAKLTGVGMAKGPYDAPISDGELLLVYDATDVTLSGGLKVAGAPLKVDLRKTLAGPARDRVEARVSGVLDDAQRQAVGLDLTRMVSGPLGFEVTYRGGDPGGNKAEALLRLDQANVRISQLYWAKPAGVPGTLKLELSLDGKKGAGAEITHFEALINDLAAEGRATLVPGTSKLQRLELDRIAFAGEDGTDVQANIARRPDNGWDVALIGEKLNIQPYIEDPDILLEFPMTITTNVDRVRLSAARRLNKVSVAANYDGTYWESITLESVLPQGSALRLRYIPEGSIRHLYVYSNNAGDALRTLSESAAVRDIRGGELAIKATREPATPNSPLEGLVQMRGFSLRGTPTGEKFLAAASGFGPFDVLAQSDLDFNLLRAQFLKTADEKVELHELLVTSPGLAMSAKGRIDMAANRLSIDGNISPFAGIDRVLKSVPWVGAFLVGVDQQGLVSVPFTGEGPVDDPEFKVKRSLQPLAPGMLRDIVKLFDSNEKDLSAESRLKPTWAER